MVNIGGRSKGCSNCRRRRVKCDETRPICIRCQRCSLVCDGPRDTVFVEAKIPKSRRSDRPRTLALTPATGGISMESKIAITPFSLEGNEHERHFCYMRRWLRPGGPIDLAMDKFRIDDIPVAATSTARAPIANQAIVSLATIYFGTQHRQLDIVKRGYGMHGNVLKRLNQALSDTNCHVRDDVILTVIALAILECLVPTGPKSYIRHMSGLELLLELRGPDSGISVREANAYRNMQHMILFAALRTRKPSILARPEWKKVLRSGCPEEDILQQELYDVLADCTVLTAQSDAMLAVWEADNEKATKMRDGVERKASFLLTQLHAWRARWEKDEQNAYLEVPATFSGCEPPECLENDMPKTTPRDGPEPFLTLLQFPHFPSVTMLLLYNTTLIHVLQILASLPVDLPNADHAQNAGYLHDLYQHRAEGFLAAERVAALEICRCLPCYVAAQPRSGPSVSSTVHWAGTTAWNTLGGNSSAEGRWMMGLLNRSGREVVGRGLWEM
ncbi:hypothetical protein BS50DRAFT_216618 [Corynespora cassiicola Philippines]|uniref:Zn(2)-C6 fungal-type domain-containing protein n=1 Tax=Corynespora cassiicola Philippines TaxID=1448308 RepID=A0A2T2N3J3_CORCC|nr:hypothetical protein BS50DRAFT_216618 [Corynespora cassiicola Philippines]